MVAARACVQVAGAVLGLVMAGIVLNPASQAQTGAADAPKSFAVYALSRGAGVPAEAQAVLLETQRLLERLEAQGVDLTVVQERIGLEGETRLCAAFADPDQGQAAQRQVEELARGVDLLNVVAEPCPDAPR